MDWTGSTSSHWDRPRLPFECQCLSTNNTRVCPGNGLRNHIKFPAFAFLPEENDVDESYDATEDGFMYSPVRHWALVGEIVDTSFFIRPRVTLETRYGEKVLVNFHLEGATKPKFFQWSDLQSRSSKTLVILYAVNRTFLDLNQGIRQESPNSVMVFPETFSNLNTELERYEHAYRRKQNQESAKVCFEC